MGGVGALAMVQAVFMDGVPEAARLGIAALWGVLMMRAWSMRDPERGGLPLVQGALAKELARARRHGHHLAVVGFRTEEGGAEQLRNLVRENDGVFKGRDGIFALLPETNRGDAEAWLHRIGEPPEFVLTGLAVFPEDGFTVEGLLGQAGGGVRLTHRGVPRLPGERDPKAILLDDIDDSSVVAERCTSLDRRTRVES